MSLRFIKLGKMSVLGEMSNGFKCDQVKIDKAVPRSFKNAMLQGTHFGAYTVRLSRGRSPASKQPQALQSQYNGGYYGYRQGHETYECAQVAQDPGIDVLAIVQSNVIGTKNRKCPMKLNDEPPTWIMKAIGRILEEDEPVVDLTVRLEKSTTCDEIKATINYLDEHNDEGQIRVSNGLSHS
ncbi:hypothetical protein Tco_0686026 [Tanacetum coccineum]